jgi:microcystin-dependent protein
MLDPYLAEISLFAGNFAPRGWAFCHGQIMPIAQYSALFSLLGTTYGGDGQTTFALPDLRGRVPVAPGQGPGLPQVELGEAGGEPHHTLTVAQMPQHNHSAQAHGDTNPGTSDNPGGHVWAASTTGDNLYGDYPSGDPMVSHAITVGRAGDSQPHNNMQPFLGLNYIIAIEGIFPSRS